MGSLKLLNIVESINKDIVYSERDMFEGFDESELREDYPTGFSFEAFKAARSYSQKMTYARYHLGKPIGTGTSRVVYRIDETKVLKLAKNRKGIAQNEAEINWYGDTYYDDILAQVIDYDRDNSYWTEMEIAFKVKQEDFQRLWGVKLKDVDLYLRNRESENKGGRGYFHINQETKDKLDENDNVAHLVSFMYDSDNKAGDLTKLNSWGKVKRPYGETLVLIDFGLTDEVYKSYYS